MMMHDGADRSCSLAEKNGPTYFKYRPECSNSGAAMLAVPRTTDLAGPYMRRLPSSVTHDVRYTIVVKNVFYVLYVF